MAEFEQRATMGQALFNINCTQFSRVTSYSLNCVSCGPATSSFATYQYWRQYLLSITGLAEDRWRQTLICAVFNFYQSWISHGWRCAVTVIFLIILILSNTSRNTERYFTCRSSQLNSEPRGTQINWGVVVRFFDVKILSSTWNEESSDRHHQQVINILH